MEELKEGWRLENLEENLEVILDYRGKTPQKSEKGRVTLSAKSVKMGYIDYSNIYYVSEETYSKFMTRGLPKKGDILLTTEAPLGCVAELKDDSVCLAQRLITLRGKKEKLNNKYLLYYLQSPRGQYELLSKATGTTVQGIKRTEFSKVKILMPSLEKQNKIASILSSLDEKIELNRKINQNLEETAQTLFKRWFIDFEFPNEEGKPYKSSGGKMIESELGEIPEGWRVGKLGDFIKFIKGKKPKILVEKEDEINKFKYLTIKSINNEEENYCSEEKVIFVSKNEIMMVMDGASSGDIYIGKEGILGSTLSKIEIEKSIDWSIIYCLLNYYKNEIKQHNTGSAIPHTDKNYIENITFFLPNNGKINYFSKIFKRILLKKIVLEDEVYKLIELRDYLLPRLMSGEISV